MSQKAGDDDDADGDGDGDGADDGDDDDDDNRDNDDADDDGDHSNDDDDGGGEEAEDDDKEVMVLTMLATRLTLAMPKTLLIKTTTRRCWKTLPRGAAQTLCHTAGRATVGSSPNAGERDVEEVEAEAELVSHTCAPTSSRKKPRTHAAFSYTLQKSRLQMAVQSHCLMFNMMVWYMRKPAEPIPLLGAVPKKLSARSELWLPQRSLTARHAR